MSVRVAFSLFGSNHLSLSALLSIIPRKHMLILPPKKPHRPKNISLSSTCSTQTQAHKHINTETLTPPHLPLQAPGPRCCRRPPVALVPPGLKRLHELFVELQRSRFTRLHIEAAEGWAEGWVRQALRSRCLLVSGTQPSSNFSSFFIMGPSAVHSPRNPHPGRSSSPRTRA